MVAAKNEDFVPCYYAQVQSNKHLQGTYNLATHMLSDRNEIVAYNIIFALEKITKCCGACFFNHLSIFKIIIYKYNFDT